MKSASAHLLTKARSNGGVYALLGISILLGPAAKAGTIFFNDAGPTVSFTASGDATTRAAGSCTNGTIEVCTVTLTGPLGNTSYSSTNILEATDNTISDTVNVVPTFDANFNVRFFTITFTSGDNLPSISGNVMREDGTVQTALSIQWFGEPNLVPGVTDVIQFQSTDGATPEPGSWLLFSTGVGLLAVGRRKRIPRN